MSGKAIIPAKVVWGYTEIPEHGENRDVRLGLTEIETGRSLVSLRTRATRLVKADSKMQTFLLSHTDEQEQLRGYATENGVKNVVMHELWEHAYYSHEGWLKWQEPSPSEKHPELLITSRRKWIFKPIWLYNRSAAVHSLPDTPKPSKAPAIQAYYACAYHGTLT